MGIRNRIGFTLRQRCVTVAGENVGQLPGHTFDIIRWEIFGRPVRELTLYPNHTSDSSRIGRELVAQCGEWK